MIAHPPCTYLTVTGNRWLSLRCVTPEQAVDRWDKRAQAAVFFMQLMLAPVPRIAVENPVGYMSTVYRKPDQIIQPWQFGHPTTKKTCLWLKGLPLLKPTNIVEVDPNDVYEYVAKNGHIKHDSRNRSRYEGLERSTHRSKTFNGIAAAMAEQWG